MRQKTKTIITVFAGTIMIAHGLRMMTQGIFFPDSFYPAPVPSSIDFWFDWFTLAIIGGLIFYLGLQSFYEQQKRKQKVRRNLFHL